MAKLESGCIEYLSNGYGLFQSILGSLEDSKTINKKYEFKFFHKEAKP